MPPAKKASKASSKRPASKQPKKAGTRDTQVQQVKPLTAEDRAVIQRIVTSGLSWLYEAGWTENDIRDFIARPSVRGVFQQISREYGNRHLYNAYRAFLSDRKLTPLAPKAIDVLERALEGPEYMTTPEGGIASDKFGNPVKITESPTAEQVRAAIEVLNRVAPQTGRSAAGVIDAESPDDVDLVEVVDTSAPSGEREVDTSKIPDEPRQRDRARRILSTVQHNLRHAKKDSKK